MEKLLTERAGLKGERDLLVVLGMILVSEGSDLEEFVTHFKELSRDEKQAMIANLTSLSLMKPLSGMPDPGSERPTIAELLGRLEARR